MRSFYVTLALLALGFSQAALATPESELGRHREDAGASPSAAATSKRYEAFVANLSEINVAIVGVKGMVCDFCARGIEKTFKKDKSVRKVDVDLANGQVLIAYSLNKMVDQKEIIQKILANGQNVTAVTIEKI